MRLLLRHPGIANLDCDFCQKFMVDPVTGVPEIGRDGSPVPRLLKMGPSFLAPCRDSSRRCPKGTPENSNELTPENELCFEHYKECRAIGEFPDDSVVRRNAAIIQEVTDAVDRVRVIEFQNSLLQILQQ